MGVAYELDAIAAAVIGGTSLAGGVGRITGTVIGTIILGVVTSGFTFLKVGAYYQEMRLPPDSSSELPVPGRQPRART